MEPLDFSRAIRQNKACCSDTACTLKVYRHFQGLEHFADVVKSQNSLVATLEQGKMCATDKGGSESIVLEMIFSICRMLGLRH